MPDVQTQFVEGLKNAGLAAIDTIGRGGSILATGLSDFFAADFAFSRTRNAWAVAVAPTLPPTPVPGNAPSMAPAQAEALPAEPEFIGVGGGGIGRGELKGSGFFALAIPRGPSTPQPPIPLELGPPDGRFQPPPEPIPTPPTPEQLAFVTIARANADLAARQRVERERAAEDLRREAAQLAIAAAREQDPEKAKSVAEQAIAKSREANELALRELATQGDLAFV